MNWRARNGREERKAKEGLGGEVEGAVQEGRQGPCRKGCLLGGGGGNAAQRGGQGPALRGARQGGLGGAVRRGARELQGCVQGK